MMQQSVQKIQDLYILFFSIIQYHYYSSIRQFLPFSKIPDDLLFMSITFSKHPYKIEGNHIANLNWH